MSDIEKLRLLMNFAKVVDLDFSRWDEHIALLVLDISQGAEEQVQRGFRKYLPLVQVALVSPRRFELNFKHHPVKATLPEGHHIQWTVIDCDVSENSDGLRLHLKSWGSEPDLICEASSIELREVDVEDAILVAPWWGKREAAPLIRPTIAEIAQMLRR